MCHATLLTLESAGSRSARQFGLGTGVADTHFEELVRCCGDRRRRAWVGDCILSCKKTWRPSSGFARERAHWSGEFRAQYSGDAFKLLLPCELELLRSLP